MERTGPRNSVLFVCTGNLCRSPMAAALFISILTKEGVVKDWRVESAGTWAQPGYKPPEEVIELMAGRGLNLKNHRSRPITAELLREFDLILAMEPGQCEAICVEFPEAAKHVHLLTGIAGEFGPVADPFGGSRAEYRQTAAEIERLLEQGKNQIKALMVSRE